MALGLSPVCGGGVGVERGVDAARFGAQLEKWVSSSMTGFLEGSEQKVYMRCVGARRSVVWQVGWIAEFGCLVRGCSPCWWMGGLEWDFSSCWRAFVDSK